MKFCKVVPAVAILLLSTGLAVQAEPIHPQLSAKHNIILGAYQQKADASFYANPDEIGKATIDLGDLGIDDKDISYLLEYRYRLNEKWLFSIGTFQFGTSGRLEGKRDFTFGGEEFEAGASLDTTLDIDTYMIEAMYSVYKTDRAEILLGAGLHMFDFSASIDSRVTVGEQEFAGSSASDDILAPLPNLRAQGFYALSPKWGLAVTLGWLSAKYEDYDGAFAYLHARTMYRFTERFGVGVGYQFIDVELSHDRDRGEIGFDIQFDGPAAYLAYSF